MVKITVKYYVYKVYLEDADGNLKCEEHDEAHFDKEAFKGFAEEHGCKVISIKKGYKVSKYEAVEFVPDESYREVK